MADVNLKRIRFRPGARLFREGDEGDSFFIIEEGTVEVSVSLLHKTEQLNIAIVGPGETLGELSVVTRTPRNATARAITEVKAIKVTENDYQVMVKDLPGWATAFIGSLAKRIQNTDIHLSKQHTKSLRTAIEHARMGKELKIAHVVQNMLFPVPEGQYGNLQVAGFYQSAYECSGDWWYHTEIGDKVFIWIGDATGHGVSAALVVSAARAVAAILEFDKELTPSKALKILNHAIYLTSKGSISMTFFIACFDKNTGVLTYSNASHESPYLLRKIKDTYFMEQHILLNKVKNPRLGEGVDREFKETSIQLATGDFIFLYTDGVTSLSNPQKLQWGEKRLLNTFYKNVMKHSSASEVSEGMKSQMAEFRKSEILNDDVTFIVLHLPS